ncbi:MAG TPA: flagellar hook-basal body protein [Opitutaceae bacterium]|nr:flagellar hook-basal body protein [Opitutaceae bacterium]
MNVGLYQSAASLSALERWQDVVSQNISSGQVTGFKKRTVEFSVQPMGEIAQDKKALIGDGQPAYFPRATYGISFQNGEVEPTNRELDIALQGEGFFAVQMPDGSRTYTRAGDLHIRADRTLANTQDGSILSDADTPIKLNPQGGPLTVNLDGKLMQGDIPLGRLQVVRFADPTKLQSRSSGTFIAPPGVDPIPVDKPQVLQFHLENSNVAPLREMVDLVTISRAYEANQKLIQSSDDLLGQALEKLG